MENPTEFDLNVAIRNWQQSLKESSVFCGENLEELETHLRDSIAVWQDRGLSEEEAFFVASHRMGSPRRLGTEYAKIHIKEVWLHRAMWMFLGVLFWGICSDISWIAANTVVFRGLTSLGYHFERGGQDLLQSSLFPSALLVLTQLVTLAICAGLGWRFAVRWPKGSSRITASRLAHSLFAFFVVFAACLILLGIHFARFADGFLMAREFSPSVLGIISGSTGIASLVMTVLQTLSITVLVVFLARRRLQLRNAV